MRTPLGSLLILATLVHASSGQMVRVEGDAEHGFRLTRGGEPYFVNGVGVDGGSLPAAAAAGANSIRIWGSDRLGQVLDEAQANGLTVCAGLWLGHPRHGFDYGDPAQLARQTEMVRRTVVAYKDHPALLAWALGNEMEGDGRDDRIWRHIEELARLVKSIDKNHPRLTVIAELGEGGHKIPSLERLCPSLDLIGINSYGPVSTVAERYARAGGTRPYLITEYGPIGWWESSKTAWDAPIEPTSTQKVEAYSRAYDAIQADPKTCLGGYAFLWGWKQEATATWFGLQLPSGERVGAVDLLTERWTGKPPTNRCPVVNGLRVEGGTSRPSGDTLRVTLEATDPEGEELVVRWSFLKEGKARGGGDRDPKPDALANVILESGNHHALLRLPKEPGAYRLFVTLVDAHCGSATANVPLQVKTP